MDVTSDASVEQLKQALQDKHGIPAAEQRLIYKGQVLKDEKKLQEYGKGAWATYAPPWQLCAPTDCGLCCTGLQNEHVLHMVRKPTQPASTGPTGQTASARPDPPVGGLPDLAPLV